MYNVILHCVIDADDIQDIDIRVNKKIHQERLLMKNELIKNIIY